MITLEERQQRLKTVGASEVYKIFNFDTEQAQNLWELKMGLTDYQELDNDSITAGNILEEDCLNYYAKENETELVCNERVEHKNVKGLVVSLDAREKDTSVPIENKVINETTWNSWKVTRGGNAKYRDELISIPKSYYLQLQTQIEVLGTEKGVFNINTLTDEEVDNPLNVVITDLHNKQIPIERNGETIKEILKRNEYMLWCIEHKTRPSEVEYLEKKVFGRSED